ncbi:MAG: Ig-like domain-containing protein [Gemmatimonadetes bacterium]|nr:Ig-like domain-containing protein [Gemmatimonadota bacterium]
MSPRRRSPAWRTRVGSLAFVAGLLACNGIITGPDDGPDTRPRSMRVTPARLDLVVGATGQMAAELYDVTGAPAVPEPGVPLGFVSEDPLVATVDGNGLVTAVGGGTTSVRAVYGALRLGIPVVVTAFPPRIELVSGGSQSAEQGSPLGAPVVVRALGSTGAPVAGVAVGFAVDTGAGAGAVGSASVTTDAAGLAQTTWTLGARLGAQSLTATAAGYQALSVPATAVPSTRVQRIDVSPAVATLPVVGATVQLVAEAFNPFDAVIPGTLFTWSSADASIAAVNATGLVTAVAPGTVAITASTGADSGSAVITVAPPAPSPVIGLAPTALAFDVVAGSPSPAAQQVAVTNTGTGTLSGLSATVTYGTGATGWLASALDGTTAPATLTVTPATGALAAGTYTADVTVASSVPGVAPASVGVTLTVRAPIGRLDLGADTTHPAALQDARTLTLVDAPAGTLAVTLRSLDPAALLLAGDSATAGASSLTVSATAGATAVGYWLQGIEGTAGATARLVAEAPGYAPDTMRVSLVSPGVTFTLASADPVDAAAGDDPLLLVRVGANGPGGFRELAVRAFGAEPVFDILALDPSVGTLAFRATAATGGADQLGVDSARFTLRAGRSATLLPDAALGQPASLSVLRSGAPGTARFALASRSGFTLVGANPQVTVTVGAAIEVSPTSLALDVVAGDPSPAPRQFSVTNRGTGALTGLSVSLGWVGNPGLVCCWVTASLDGTTAPATLTVTPTTDAVPAGSYAGEILIASSMPGVDPVAIPMTLVVRAPALPRLDLGPDLRHPAGLQARRMVQVPDAVVDPVMVTIRSLDSTGVLLSVTEVDAGVARDSVEIAGGAREAFYWMQGVEGRAGGVVTLVAEAPGYAPDTMVVTLSNPAFVAQQTGDSSVPATGGEDPVIRLLVGDEVSPGLFSPMAVRAGGTPPSFTATTETPATANVQFFAGPAVIGADQGPATSVTFAIAPTNSATADGTGAAVPASLRLARTGTAGGATVSVAGPSGYVALAPTVSFTLTAVPAPAIAVTPASIDLNTTVGATPPAARDLSVTNGGTGTLSGLSADVAYGPGASDWLALSLSGTTAPATLTVTPATAGVPEGIYTATITIASSLPGVDSVEVAVTLTVDPAPPSGVVNWINPAGGQFGDGANWSTGTVPGAADTAVIALPGTYTVIHVDDLLEVGRLVVGGAGGTGDTVTLAFSAVRFSAEGGIQVNAGGVVDITGGPMSGGSAGMVNDGTLFLRDFNSYPASITSALSGGGTIHVDGIVEITGAWTTQNSTRLEIATVSADSAVLTVANGFEMRGQIVLSNVDAENARLAALVVTNGVLRLEEPGRLFSEYGTQGGERVLRAELDNGYWMHVRHPLTIDRPGAAHRSSGYIELSDNGSLTILQSGASPSFTNTQSIILLDDRELIVTGGVFAQRGRVLGVGTVDVSASSIAPATEFAPGFGVLRITGDLPLGSESVLLYEARSASLATDGYGRIPVSGAATLAGALQFSLVDGFVPAIGDSFTLLTASSVTGTFGQLFLPALPAGEWAIDYNATSVVLRVASAAPPAVTLDIAGDDIVGVGLSTTVDVALTAPAGAGGVTVTVTSDDPSRVRVPAPGTVVIAAGGSNGTLQVDGLALGSTTLRANAAGYTEGTLAVAATNQIISVPTTLNVPFGLTTSIPVQLATPAPAGGVTVTLSSSDPSRVGVVTSTVAFAAGATLASGTLSGVSIGTATITASAPGWVSDQTAATTSAELNVVESSLAINAGFGGTMTVELRSGGSSISAPSPGVTVSLTAVDASCVTVPATLTIATGSTSATAPVSYGGSATTPCATHVRATATNMQPDSINVTVAPAPGISVSEVTLGEGTQVASNASLLASNYGSTTVRVESSNPSLVLVAPNATTVGSAFTDFPLTAPNQNVSFVLQALEGVTGTATITVSAPGFVTATATVTVRGLGIDILFLPTSTSAGATNSPFQVRLGTLNAAGTGIQAEHPLRFGGAARTVTVTNSSAAAARLVTTALTGQSVTAQIVAGQNRTASGAAAGGVEFDPLASGTTTVTASSAGALALPGSSVTVTVSP